MELTGDSTKIGRSRNYGNSEVINVHDVKQKVLFTTSRNLMGRKPLNDLVKMSP